MDNVIYNPTTARKNLYKILKDVNESHMPITIKSQNKNNESAVLIDSDDWNAIQETLFLAERGVDKVIKEREADKSGWTDVDDIDWDKL